MAGDAERIQAALEDWRTAPLEPRVKGALGFLEKLSQRPEEVGPADVRAAREAGVTDEALEEAVYVCFLFSTVDRLADALDFQMLGPRSLKVATFLLQKRGYRTASLAG